MGAIKDNMNIKKDGVSMKLYERKGINESTVFYLKMERYPPEGSSPQEGKKKLPEEKKVQNGNDKK